MMERALDADWPQRGALPSRTLRDPVSLDHPSADARLTASPEPCLLKLHEGDVEAAWSLFVDRYRRLIFAVIRRHTTESDEVMDAFAHVCEQLRVGDLARLRKYPVASPPRAAFSTWLVAVVRNLVIDWYRAQHGRPRTSTAEGLSPVARRIYDLMWVRGWSQREAKELVLGDAASPVARAEYVRALREMHGAVVRGVVEPPMAMDVSNVADVSEDERAEWIGPDARERLQDALRVLDRDAQVTVLLFVVEEIPAADIARMMGLANAKAVYNKVYRALAMMRDALARQGIHRGDL